MRGMHPAQIKAQIRLRGKTLTELAFKKNVSPTVINKALVGASPLGERIISEFIDVPLHELWPQRWTKNGLRFDS